MTESKSKFPMLELNLGILFMSTSGVLGKYIELPPYLTICLRSLIAFIALFVFCKWRKFSFKIEKKDLATVILSGIFLGLHWVTYFYALALSNVAIGMLSLFSYPALTAIIEPLYFRNKVKKFHILLGVIVLVGIYFLVPDFDFGSNNLKAVGFGVLSALCYSLRNIIMKGKVSDYNGSVLMSYQLLVVGLCISPFLYQLNLNDAIKFLPATLGLAFLTTSVGHTLFLYSFKNFSAATSSIISSLQPIYGIVFGAVFLSEYPEPSTLIGGTIILFTVIAESVRIARLKKV